MCISPTLLSFLKGVFPPAALDLKFYLGYLIAFGAFKSFRFWPSCLENDKIFDIVPGGGGHTKNFSILRARG